jgi:hypothetical protein
MRRSLFLIMALLLAAPAMATVTITCTDEGGGGGVCQISYIVSGEPAKVRAFALDVTVDNGATIESVTDYKPGEGNKYGIFPGSIDLTDPNVPIWNDPIAPSSDPGAEGTGLGTNRVIIEMGSLYDPDVNSGPSDTDLLLKLGLGANGAEDCNVAIVVETTRGGVVLENGDAVGITSAGCKVAFEEIPPCWLWAAQCYGDCHGNDGDVDADDFLIFKPAFGAVDPDPDYDPCADLDRDGDIDADDFLIFKPNFGSTGLSGCTYP